MTIYLRLLLWGIVMTFCVNAMALQLNAGDAEELHNPITLEDLKVSERMLPDLFLSQPIGFPSAVDYFSKVLALLIQFPAIEDYRNGRILNGFCMDPLSDRYDAMLAQLSSEDFRLQGSPPFWSQFALLAGRLSEVIYEHITVLDDSDPVLAVIAECLEAIYALFVFQIQFEQEVLPHLNKIQDDEGDLARIKALIFNFYKELFDWILELKDLKSIEFFLRESLPQIRNFHLVFRSPETLTVQRVQELVDLFRAQWRNRPRTRLDSIDNQQPNVPENQTHEADPNSNNPLSAVIVLHEVGSNFM